MFDSFHFLHPLWLLALLPLAGLVWLLQRRSGGDDAWRRVVDPDLLPLLLSRGGGRASRSALWLLATGWLLAVLALADPTWEQRPRPLFETRQALVIVLDLSRSMEATDLKPSRLFQARLKVEDILDREREGQTGLVVFAGDAFSVVPLTRDADTIRAMLGVLTPELMPVQGSRVDLALKRAGELLKQAGIPRGRILVIGDGMESEAAIDEAARLRDQGYRVSVLGVGTAAGAPVPDGRGGSLRDDRGNPVIAGLDQARLQRLATAGGGRYARLQPGDQDLDLVLSPGSISYPGTATKAEKSDLDQTAWKEQGPLLTLLLLPLAALAFRRGWLLGLLLTGLLLPLPEPVTAAAPAVVAESRPVPATGLWRDLWQRRDQQAAEALARGDAEAAARLARDPLRRGSAEYRRGDFAAALQAFEQASGPDADYNRGNALARLGRYREAIAAYDQALKQAPGMEDARANRAAVEKLLQQQKQAQRGQPRQAGGKQEEQGSKQQQTGGGQQQQGSNQQLPGGGEQQQNPDRQQAAGGQQQQNPNQQQAGEEQQQQGPNRQQAAGGEQQQNPNQQQAGEGQQQATGGEQQQNPNRQQAGGGREQEQTAGNPFARAAAEMEKQAQGEANGGEDRTGETPPRADRGSRDEATNSKGNRPREEKSATAPRGRAGDDRATPLTSEEQMAAEQWLRRIPDDPGGLLRRKFLYQYRQRGGVPASGRQDW